MWGETSASTVTSFSISQDAATNHLTISGTGLALGIYTVVITGSITENYAQTFTYTLSYVTDQCFTILDTHDPTINFYAPRTELTSYSAYVFNEDYSVGLTNIYYSIQACEF